MTTTTTTRVRHLCITWLASSTTTTRVRHSCITRLASLTTMTRVRHSCITWLASSTMTTRVRHSCITSLASSTTTTRVRHSCITWLALSSSFHYGYAMMPGLLFTHLLDQSNSNPMHTRLPMTKMATDIVDLTMSCSKLVVQTRQSQQRLY